jgi:hypothetical protein
MNSAVSSKPGMMPAMNRRPIEVSGGDAVEDHGDAGRDQDAQRAAGGDRAGGEVGVVAALAHLGDAHLADRRAGRRRGTGERREQRAGAEVGNHQRAGHAVQPARQRLVEVGAGARGSDRRAHDDEHRQGHQGEIVQAGEHRFRHEMHAAPAVERQHETQCHGAEAEGDRQPGGQHQQGGDHDQEADHQRRQSLSSAKG